MLVNSIHNNLFVKFLKNACVSTVNGIIPVNELLCSDTTSVHLPNGTLFTSPLMSATDQKKNTSHVSNGGVVVTSDMTWFEVYTTSQTTIPNNNSGIFVTQSTLVTVGSQCFSSVHVCAADTFYMKYINNIFTNNYYRQYSLS